MPSTYDRRGAACAAAGRTERWPASRSRSRAKTLGPSKRGPGHQSTDPSRVTSAAVWQSLSSARSPMPVDMRLRRTRALRRLTNPAPARCAAGPVCVELRYAQTLIAARSDFVGALPRRTLMNARARTVIVEPRCCVATIL